jgi:CheY-like chemotaxis protein
MDTILIVDDVQTDRELIGMVVAKAGYRPAYAVDGMDALEKAMIVLDVVMPNQDGYKTCRDLKKDPMTTTIPVVLVTSKGADSDKFWGQKQGAVDHLAKPFSQEHLLSCIRMYAK